MTAVLDRYIASALAQRDAAMRHARGFRHNHALCASMLRIARQWSRQASAMIRERGAL